jgi:hypothetical protein
MGPLGPLEMMLGPWPKEEEEKRGQAHWALEIRRDRDNGHAYLNESNMNIGDELHSNMQNASLMDE